jgi:hypothetical protein
MTRHRTFRVLTYKTEALFVDVAARDEEGAVARAEKLWEAGQHQQFHALLEYQPVRFEVDEEASEHLSEVVNEDRARWAEQALKAFARDTGSGTGEEGVTDLICDLGHYAHAAGIDFADVLQRAGRTWADEIIDEVQP